MVVTVRQSVSGHPAPSSHAHQEKGHWFFPHLHASKLQLGRLPSSGAAGEHQTWKAVVSQHAGTCRRAHDEHH